MQIKEVFEQAEDGKLSYDEFMELAKEASFVDLKEGNYVSKQKYDDELGARAKEIETLNGTISTRDTDLAELQKKLEEAGTDADALAKLSTDFEGLKTKYDDDVKSYKAQLKKQAYEFAVREFASSKKFSSDAAKRDFVGQMIAKDLKMEEGKILGADDFVAVYTQNNQDAFITEADTIVEQNDLPRFLDQTPGGQEPVDATGGFADAFHFTNIHPDTK